VVGTEAADLETELESEANEAAASNSAAFAAVRDSSGVCSMSKSTSRCCCVPGTELQCDKLIGSFFYPGVKPGEKLAWSSQTCSAKGLCCKESQTCPTAMGVTVVAGENLEKQSKVYVKVYVDNYAEKTKVSSWNEILNFPGPGLVAVEVKWKKAFGAGSYGVLNVPTRFWLSDEQVDVNVPKFGKLTLRVRAHGPRLGHGVDDDFDASLCADWESADQVSKDATLKTYLTELEAEAPMATKLNKDTPAFLNVLAHKPNQQSSNKFMTRDYTLIIDRSGSMGFKDLLHVPKKMAGKLNIQEGQHELKRWLQVSGALQYLAPYVVAEDPDGIGVYFFDSQWDEAGNVCDSKHVIDLFHRNQPGGGTYLGPVLKEAMKPDTVGRAETIFILTDGRASDPEVVKHAIISYTMKMCKPEMLSISFIQVGSDPHAQNYLNSLDDDLERLGARFDIVDAMTKDEMLGKSFMDVVELSVHD